MMQKLTPRQNELISEILCRIAFDASSKEDLPERLKTIRRALVSELEAVTAETSTESYPTARSISG